MAHIEPFRAFRYDVERVSLSKVATQPYDKITPEMQERYYAASPYNLVGIILGKHEASDGPDSNAYTRAAARFRAWRQEGILRQDPAPSIYRYVQRFSAPTPAASNSLQFERQGFIALGKIEDYSAGIVFRHEQTLSKPKADRLQLLRATRAHFGQIFMLYSDPADEIDKQIASSRTPDMQVQDEYGVLHQVWRISDSGIIQAVKQAINDKKLLIADGHHRYETALNYRNERRAEAGAKTAHPAAYEFVMMTFINMESPGLLILPTHRVLHGIENFSLDGFIAGANRFFNSVEEADPELTPERASAILKEAGHTGTSFVVVARNRVLVLSRPQPAAWSFEGISVRQQGLDVVQLHRCLLEAVLGISPEAIREQKNVTYVRDAAEAMKTVRSGEADMAFLMNPVRIHQMRDIAFAGEVLPQKSTDFYPKLLSGLTIYGLD